MASETDKIWFSNNIEKLEAQYKGQYIAIHNEKVIANSDNFDTLSEMIMELKKSSKIKGIPIVVRASKKNPAAINIPSI